MEVAKKLLIENQDLIVSIMIFILIFFVVFLWVWLKRTAHRNNLSKTSNGGSSVKKYFEKELREKIKGFSKEELQKIQEFSKEELQKIQEFSKVELRKIQEFSKVESRKMQEFSEKGQNFEQQIRKIEKEYQKELETRKEEKAQTDRKTLEEGQKIKESVNTLIKKLDDLSHELENTNTQVTTLQSNAEDTKEEINNLEKRSSSLSLKDSKNLFLSLERRVDNLQEQLKEHHKQMENWYRVFESIDADMVEITNRLKHLETERK